MLIVPYNHSAYANQGISDEDKFKAYYIITEAFFFRQSLCLMIDSQKLRVSQSAILVCQDATASPLQAVDDGQIWAVVSRSCIYGSIMTGIAPIQSIRDILRKYPWLL